MSESGPLHPEVEKTRAMGGAYREKVAANKKEVAVIREQKAAEKAKLTDKETAEEAELVKLADNREDSVIAQFAAEQLAEIRAEKQKKRHEKLFEQPVEEKLGVGKELKEKFIKESETEAKRRAMEAEQVVDFVELCESRGSWPTVELRAFGPYIDRAFLKGKMTKLVLQQFEKNPEALPESMRKSIRAEIDSSVQKEIETRTAKLSLTDAAMREKLLEKIRLDASSEEKQQAHFAALKKAAESDKFKIDLSTPGAAAVAIRAAMMGQDQLFEQDGVTIRKSNEQEKLSAKDVVNIMATFETRVQDEIDDVKREEIWKLASKEEWLMSAEDKKRKQELNRMYKGSDGVEAQKEFEAGTKIAKAINEVALFLRNLETMPEVITDILQSAEKRVKQSTDMMLKSFSQDVDFKTEKLEEYIEFVKKESVGVRSWANGSDEEVVARGKFDAGAVNRLKDVQADLEVMKTDLLKKVDISGDDILKQAEQEAGRLRDQLTGTLRVEQEKDRSFLSGPNYPIYLQMQDRWRNVREQIREALDIADRTGRVDISSIKWESKDRLKKEFGEQENVLISKRAELLKVVEKELTRISQTLSPTYYAQSWRNTAERMMSAASFKTDATLKKGQESVRQLQILQDSKGAWNEFWTGERKAGIAKLKVDIARETEELAEAEKASKKAADDYTKARQFMIDINIK